MGATKHYKSTLERAKKIRELTQRYYEPGNNQRCYKAVWRKYVYPVYPMCYHTYLTYLGIPTEKTRPTAIELCLFDFFDKSPRL
ncbi:hypothetical protein Prede_2599 [Prevotella dentalis DSM 3688]|uniref:Uncharacterized protein n=1 Tax=Prevotella dentalis (strain ATCC 49559 / DSM 3688 / JCM 13448 / NCTC 12043 / ES 2772) TaxID=908937 RepID=F9D7A2_PREDD|nr:hypothetical protein Prede_2490 [Prevotella dentalis DSM 3688]AGB29833.1 hypothetical protein Prede_2599 [Prevotella dentalis DSM 3688]EGQ11468.1 hypothetical protein HMPREF9136_2730 [Prevotella dentalis DSM 3688]